MKLNLNTIPEPTDSRYSCYNTGGVEVEVGEFLHGLVRMIKPEAILETGTHKGIAASYMATALKENGFGKLTTIEYEPVHYNDAKTLFEITGLEPWIHQILKDSKDIEVATNQYDFIFLDTEPHLRFDELVRFWHGLKPGGFVGIHDLGEGMGQTGQTVNGIMDWPFGTMPDSMKELILEGELRCFHFNTPRGLFLGQKKKDGFYG